MVRQYSMIILLLVMFLPAPGGGTLLGALLGPVQQAVGPIRAISRFDDQSDARCWLMSGGSWLAMARYRWLQGWAALWPRFDAAERAAALTCLPGPARVVFRSLPIAFQCHHLLVHRRLHSAGCRDRDLLAAALLHDIGKVDGRHRVWLWQRIVVVLLRPFPAAMDQLAARPSSGWRYGFYLHAQHPSSERSKRPNLAARNGPSLSLPPIKIVMPPIMTCGHCRPLMTAHNERVDVKSLAATDDGGLPSAIQVPLGYAWT